MANHRPISDPKLTADAVELAAHLARRQDLMCLFFFGSTMNGRGEMPIKIDPTPESWCGQVKNQVDKIPGLQSRFIYGTGVICGVVTVLHFLWK